MASFSQKMNSVFSFSDNSVCKLVWQVGWVDSSGNAIKVSKWYGLGRDLVNEAAEL